MFGPVVGHRHQALHLFFAQAGTQAFQQPAQAFGLRRG
jgi:hypothetical protein